MENETDRQIYHKEISMLFGMLKNNLYQPISNCKELINGKEKISYHDWNMREHGKCFCSLED